MGPPAPDLCSQKLLDDLDLMGQKTCQYLARRAEKTRQAHKQSAFAHEHWRYGRGGQTSKG
jgi:hypothetical protein